MAQVREHTESTARQYALAEEAARLGWPASSIDVIDADQGVSGRSTEGRDGFKGLVARVCLGEVGAIFGLEVSRLARSSADLSRLLEYARLTDTLVIDGDGVYDLAEFNDRLLLGLKGTMSEAELSATPPASCLAASSRHAGGNVGPARRAARSPGCDYRLRRRLVRPRSVLSTPTGSRGRPPVRSACSKTRDHLAQDIALYPAALRACHARPCHWPADHEQDQHHSSCGARWRQNGAATPPLHRRR